MLDRTIVFILIVVFSAFIFGGMSVLTFWMGKVIKAHTDNASKGLIPAKSWFGVSPERDTKVELRADVRRNIQYFKLVAVIFFASSLFLGAALPVWIILAYTQVFS